MKLKRVGQLDPVVKVELLTRKDSLEYQRTRGELVKVLEKIGGYEPAVDNIYVDQIARTAVYAARVEIFLDSDGADVETYSRVTAAKLKFSKIIDNAIHQLALSRRDRMGKQTQANLEKVLQEALLRGVQAGEH